MRQKNIIVAAFFLVFFSMSIEKTNAQSCDCNEFIYLNDTNEGGVIHKVLINSDGTITEVLKPNGEPWYQGNGPGTLTSPHGLGTDLNGYLYIAENQGTGGDIRKLDCGGNIFPTSSFVIEDVGPFNINSIGNTLYSNGVPDADFEDLAIYAWDLCTGEEIGHVLLDSTGMTWGNDWGFHIAEDGTFYATNSLQNQNVPKAIYKFNPTEADFVNNTVFPYLVSSIGGDNIINVGEMELPDEHGIMGITTDPSGNIYVVVGRFSGTIARTKVMKYDSNGAFVAETAYDELDDGLNPTGVGTGGWYQSIGITYSETLDNIFLSSNSKVDGCLVQFDTDLNYIDAYLPDPTGGGKGISILKECCPNPSTIVIDTLFCNMAIPQNIFLQDFINCDGIICEGIWSADPSNTGIDFNDCNNSIDINGEASCGTFTLFSDGSSGVSQCGQFSITVNIETGTVTTATVTGDQILCPTDTPADLVATSTTAGVTYQWQMSTTSCTDGFTDIAGATTATYTPASITQTVYYRVVTSVTGGCASGSCSEPSNCITLTLETDCETFDARLGKTVDNNLSGINEQIMFTLTVYNDGTGDLTGIEVTDLLPAGLNYISDNSGGNYDETTGIWQIGAIAAGDSAVIEITSLVLETGVILNQAEITAMDQIDLDSTPDNGDINEDDISVACVSIPVECCDNEAINVDLTAPTGFTNYQWYLDGVLITGETSETYIATATGSYTYTVDGVGPTGDCMGELCCPVIIEQVSCCPPTQCIQVGVTKLEE